MESFTVSNWNLIKLFFKIKKSNFESKKTKQDFDASQLLLERLHWQAPWQPKKWFSWHIDMEFNNTSSLPGEQGAQLICQSVHIFLCKDGPHAFTCAWNKSIKYLLDDLHQILQNLSPLTDILVRNDSCGQVTQDVGAHGLDRIEVSGWGRMKVITLSHWSKTPSRLEWHVIQHFGCLFDPWRLEWRKCPWS